MRPFFSFLLFVLFSACPAPESSPDASADVALPPAPQDPFAYENDNQGLTNVSTSLVDLLENGELENACEAFRENRQDARLELLCGKSMFFFESFNTQGVPTVLIDFFGTRFESTLGRSFSNIGLFENPLRDDGRPLGLHDGASLGNVDTLAFTCASCHFAQLEDGRFAVGAPNHDYDYGKHILSISLAPQSANPLFNENDHAPLALDKVRDILDVLENDFALRSELGLSLLPLLGAEQPMFTEEQEHYYASWKLGTMDFLMAPLVFDDEVHTVSKITSLFDIASADRLAEFDLESAQLGWTGGTESLLSFVKGFAQNGDSEIEYSDDDLMPLVKYIQSLSSPDPIEGDGDVERGREVFFNRPLEDESQTCLSCHSGPSGMGPKLYRYDEIGTDAEMAKWGDPTFSGTLCCGLDQNAEATAAIKSPRLSALFLQKRFLHNGSLDDLESLICLSPRVENDEPAFSNGGHTFGCDALSDDDKRALLAFLRSL